MQRFAFRLIAVFCFLLIAIFAVGAMQAFRQPDKDGQPQPFKQNETPVPIEEPDEGVE